MKWSDWIKEMTVDPNKRSPYFNLHTKQHGFHGVVSKLGKNWSDVGFNRAAGPTISKKYLDDMLSNFNSPEGYSFSCPNGEFVKSVEYDPEHLWMKVTFGKSRTGAKGGVPPGSTSVYDHVPPNVFQYMKDINSNLGRVGQVFWDIIRVRGFEKQSRYPYTDRE